MESWRIFRPNIFVRCGEDMEDTIAGISTAVGNAGIAIIRMSGESAFEIADRVFRGRHTVSEQKSHTIQYGKIVGDDGEEIDEVLLTKMAAPKTYTRENIVEINCHGGYYVAGRILGLLIEKGARPAEPGEFTKRAFMNGRIDLSQAEAVMDLIQAKTDKSSRAAMNQLEGKLSSELNSIIDDLTSTLAHIEVDLDYPEYDHEELSEKEVEHHAKDAMARIERLLGSFHYGKILREGMDVVIIGKPNTGKSSLLNYLTRRNRAIVTDIPGTTRDVIEETVNIGGIPMKLTDTAGVRETSDPVESIGVERSIEALKNADFVILMLDAADWQSPEDRKLFDMVKAEGVPYVKVFNKMDLLRDAGKADELKKIHPDGIFVSITRDNGLDILEQRLIDFARGNKIDVDNQVLVTNARHERQLRLAHDSLESALEAINSGMTLDIIALELRTALDSLGRITGKTAEDEVINAIFSRFCIGK